MIYRIVVRPNHNLAYHDTYLRMCTAELSVMAEGCGVELSNIGHQKINKATLLSFETPEPPSPTFFGALFHLSFFHTAFKVHEGGLLEPIEIDESPDFEDHLSVRLKYNGKTNEQLTRMMLSMAYHSSAFSDLSPTDLKLLDPLCGRGTTLFEGMIRGFDVYGVDRDKKSVGELELYITRFLKEAQFKHKKIRGKVVIDRQNRGEHIEIKYARSKEEARTQTRTLKVLRGETTDLKGIFKRDSMHLILADLPYNIQHSASQSHLKGEGMAPLLEAGLRAWAPLHKRGGVIALSWNLFTDPRARLADLLTEAGYEVFDEGMWRTLEHRVSQAIKRDLLFARKR